MRAEGAPLNAIAMGFVCLVAAVGFTTGPEYAAIAVGALSLAVLPLIVIRTGAARRVAATATEVQTERLFQPGTVVAIIAVAVFLRIAVAIVLNATSLWTQFAPDALYYELTGQALLDSWSGPVSDLHRWFGDRSYRPFYSHLNAYCLYLFETARYPMSILNAIVGIVVAWLFARFTAKLYGARAGDYMLVLGLFFPSLVVWSCMNIREVWSHLIFVIVLHAAYRVKQRYNPLDIALLLSAIGAMYFVRPYLVPLLIGGVGLSLLVVRIRQVPYAIVGVIALGVFIQAFGTSVGLDPDLLSRESLEKVHQMRVNLAFGGSAYGTDVDTRTFAGSIAYLPVGVLRFLFAPFPWNIDSWRQLITVPESLLWFYIVYRAVRGMIFHARRNLTKMAAPLFVLVVIVSAYALASGNEGTAYRHRAQVMLIVFVFAAADLARRHDSRKTAEGEAG